MKTIKFFIFCMVAALIAQAQDVPPFVADEAEIVPPKFKESAMATWQSSASINDYVAGNFNLVIEAGDMQEGTEVVNFLVTEEGKIRNIKIINSVSREVDQEITRVLSNTNNMWIPGQNNGIPVAMEKEIAIQIKVGISDTEALEHDFTKIAERYFTKGAEKLLIEQKTRKALHQFEHAARYKPYDEGVLFMLALCNMELGKNQEANKYISRVKKISGQNSIVPEHFAHYANFKSYQELIELLAKNQ